MATRLEHLRKLLVLSGPPVWTGTREQWSEAHHRLGKRFPVDYLQFVSIFGHCTVDRGCPGRRRSLRWRSPA